MQPPGNRSARLGHVGSSLKPTFSFSYGHSEKRAPARTISRKLSAPERVFAAGPIAPYKKLGETVMGP